MFGWGHLGCGRRGCFRCRVAGVFGAPSPRCLAGWIHASALSLTGGERRRARRRRQGRGHVIWAQRGAGGMTEIIDGAERRRGRLVLYQLRRFGVGKEMVARMSGGYRVLQSKRGNTVNLAVLNALKFGAVWDVHWGKRRKFRGPGDGLGFATEPWRTG
ncbi:hypothetical protein DFH09DRAFT_1152173 [Mycena vulgaris]|nr:hypothetical protein DFH09DRAFT_1152173 [Mycena vulgaris]